MSETASKTWTECRPGRSEGWGRFLRRRGSSAATALSALAKPVPRKRVPRVMVSYNRLRIAMKRL